VSTVKVNIIESLSEHHKLDLVELYKNEFWCNKRKMPDVEIMLENSDIIFGAENTEKRLVGFVRVLTDYVYKATIFDLIVQPACRGKTIGFLLMDNVINHPKLEKIEHFDLNCIPSMIKFYKQWQFTDDLGEIIHMRRHNEGNIKTE